jgi:putative redox protein
MAEKHAVINWLKGITFAAKADSNHWVIMDGPAEFGGSNAGSRPTELVLMGLGGCTASDVASILRKKRVPLAGMEVRLSGKEANEHPKAFTDIHIEFLIYGDGISPKDVERAIELSATQYCSVSAMLVKSVKIEHSYKILPASENP